MDLDEKYLLVLSQAAKTRQLLSGGAVNYGLGVWAKMQNMCRNWWATQTRTRWQIAMWPWYIDNFN